MREFKDEQNYNKYLFMMSGQAAKLTAKLIVERIEWRDQAAPGSIDYRIHDDILNKELIPELDNIGVSLDIILRRYRAGQLLPEELGLDLSPDEWRTLERDITEVRNILLKAGIVVRYTVAEPIGD